MKAQDPHELTCTLAPACDDFLLCSRETSILLLRINTPRALCMARRLYIRAPVDPKTGARLLTRKQAGEVHYEHCEDYQMLPYAWHWLLAVSTSSWSRWKTAWCRE